MRPTGLAFLTLAILAAAAPAQDPQTYPEGAAIPRAATPLEREAMRRNPLEAPDAVTPPPSGPLYCASEYDPMEAIIVSWEGPTAWLNLLSSMAMHITTTGNADVYVVCDTNNERNSASTRLSNAGVGMSRVNFFVRRTDSIWMRDYGPRYVFQGDCRAIIDHTYNVPRPLDNQLNRNFAPFRGHALYELPLVHGGGNYHLDSLGRSRTTRLIVNENRQYTEAQIHDIWNDYQNVDTSFYQPFPRSVDATQHIDMWMQVIADDAVVVSDWPFNPGSIQDQICDGAAETMALEGYTVFRVPARAVGGVHYTYTNVVMCNDLVLIPSYTNSQVTQHNAPALQAWNQAVPTKTVVQLNCQSIVTAAGVMHCIVQHMPAHRGGLDPTAYLVDLNGGERLPAGTSVEVSWISDDDEAVTSVDLLLSTDGGATFPTVLAAAAPPIGTFTWTVPDLCSGQARLRVVARDEAGRTGFDDSDGDFTIDGTGCAAASLPYGAGTAGQLGVPTLSSGVPVLGTVFALDVAGAWPNSAAILIFGGAPASAPFGGSTLLVQFASFFALPVSATGDAQLSLVAPAIPALTGVSLFWQAWIDGDPAAGFPTTNGLETRFGR